VRPDATRLHRRLGVVLSVMVLAGIGSREWYPFSPFPMYAAFTPTSWHVYLTDGDDHLVSPLTLFGVSAVPLRRIYERRVIVERDAPDQPPETADGRAAVAILKFLVAEARPQPDAPPPPARLRLWRVQSRVDGDHVASTSELLGETALP
jgi:hypothetical protein